MLLSVSPSRYLDDRLSACLFILSNSPRPLDRSHIDIPKTLEGLPRAAVSGWSAGGATAGAAMLFENQLRPPDCLVREIEPAVEFAELEFSAFERGQGRGGGQPWRRGRGALAARYRGGDGRAARPAREAAG
jgi:hypothetical protein